jgi:hypothetical protein
MLPRAAGWSHGDEIFSREVPPVVAWITWAKRCRSTGKLRWVNAPQHHFGRRPAHMVQPFLAAQGAIRLDTERLTQGCALFRTVAARWSRLAGWLAP